jgi:hypothetical protein
MADVMLEDTRIHHLDLGLPDADVIPAAARLPAAGRHVDEQLRWFGERHRAIAPDLKGFGGTPDAATPGRPPPTRAAAMDPPRRRPSAADQPAGRPAGGPGDVAAGRDGAAGQAADGHQPARRIGGLEALTNRPGIGPDPTGSTCPPWWSAAPPTSWSPGDGRRHGRPDPGCRAGHHRRRRPPGDPGAARGGQPGRRAAAGADLTAGPPGGGGGHPGRLQAVATPAGQRQPRGEAAGRQAGKRPSGRS